MTDKTPKTLPQDVRARALTAIAHLKAWNSAVHLCRALEALTGQPGRVELELEQSDVFHSLWGQKNLAGHTLDTLVQEARANGWSPDDFYTALGQPRPVKEPQGPHIMDWYKGDR